MINETNKKMANDTGSKKRNAGSNKKGRIIKFTENSQQEMSPKLLKQQRQETSPYPKLDIQPDDIVFALDIGTRTVVGVVGVQEENYFRVIATEIYEHRNRAMLDGQIHDIDQVALAVSEVKRKLEVRIGYKLKHVAIAAAGRVLKTCQVRVDKNLDQVMEVDADLVGSLEIEGIQKAQMILDETIAAEDKTQFYCVGYSVINYYLNGFVISKLTGHRAKSIGADVLATFLPFIVVDSLYSVMNKVGLEVRSLTLEPIAAINATIPPDLRLLNLALVDIGAGTSDIALTKSGSVIAYAMVPIAGDEITERISQHYLVDFKTGENIKTLLSSAKKDIVFTDIMKKKYTVSSEEVMQVIEETLQLLASAISQRILEYNTKAPNAVFLVGGGSRIPRLPKLIAQQLGLPEERVVVRGRDVIRDIKFSDKKLYGPESITPFGIAITAQMYSGKDFISVTVNEKKIKLFNSKKLTVADALILFGFDAENLIGRSGKRITFYINGEERHVRGEYGKSAEIYVGSKVSSLDTPIVYGDNIKVIPAQDGKDATVRAGELVTDYYEGLVMLNGNPVDISTQILINGKQVSSDTLVKDGDKVVISQIRTLRELLDAGGFNADCCEISVNNNYGCALEYILRDKDQVVCIDKNAVRGRTSESISVDDSFDTGSLVADSLAAYIQVPGEPSPQVQSPQVQADMSGETTLQGEMSPQVETSPSFEVIVNGAPVNMDGNRSHYIFVDIFNYINFDLSKPQGTIVLKLNGRPAAFTDNILPGDEIEIYWK